MASLIVFAFFGKNLAVSEKPGKNPMVYFAPSAHTCLSENLANESHQIGRTCGEPPVTNISTSFTVKKTNALIEARPRHPK